MEYKKLCKTCGKVYCYTDQDLKNNKQNATMSVISAIGGVASAFCGTIFHTAHLSNQTDKYNDKIVDYTKCPYCNSRNVVSISDAEFSKIAKNSGTEIAGSKKVEVSANATPESLIKRAELFLEDGEWDYADAYADSCLDAEPENAYAYVCKMMAELRVKRLEELKDCKKSFENNDNYKKIIRFANEELKAKLNEYIAHIRKRNTNEELTLVYISASKQMDSAKTETDFISAAEVFATIPQFKDSDEKQKLCYVKAEEVRKNTIYTDAKTKMESGIISRMEEALKLFETIDDWEDCRIQIKLCNEKIEKQKVKDKRKRKMYLIIGTASAAVLAIIALIINFVIEPNSKYNSAVQLSQKGEYAEAISIFSELVGYKDSGDKVIENKEKLYDEAMKDFFQGEYESAVALFSALGDFKDSKEKISEVKDEIYNSAIKLLNEKKYEESFLTFRKIYGHKDSIKYIQRFEVSYDHMVYTKYSNVVQTIENTFNERGQLVERIEKRDGYTWKNQYKYNAYGDCIMRINEASKDDYYDRETYKYFYDKNKNLIKRVDDDGGMYEYFYDSQGNCVKSIYTSDTYKATSEYFYDSNGNCIKEIDGNDVYEYIYDELNNCVKKVYNGEVIEYFWNQYGDCIKAGYTDFTYFTYDQYGRELTYGKNIDAESEVEGEYKYDGVRITYRTSNNIFKDGDVDYRYR